MLRKWITHSAGFGLGLLCVAGPLVWAENVVAETSALQVVRQTGIHSGLCVHLGTTDGSFETTLASNGTLLVHGLTLSEKTCDKARRAIRKHGLYSLATIDVAKSFERLPYADNLVNVLVADLDRLGAAAPTKQEMLRVIVPEGFACLKQGGKWTKTSKVRPEGMDDWTHYDHGADGNPVSRDTLVGPVTSLRWYAAPSVSRAGSMREAGLRITNGRIIYAIKDFGVQGVLPRGSKNLLVCRDAYNGVLLWKRAITSKTYTPYRHGLVASGERIYTLLEDGGSMVALDAATGKTVREYSEGAQVDSLKQNVKRRDDVASRHMVVRVDSGKIVQAYGSTIYVLDEKSGKRLWTYSEGKDKSIPLLVVGEGKVFAVVGKAKTFSIRGTVAIQVGRIVALDLASGKLLWKNSDFAGDYMLRLVYHKGNLPIAHFTGEDRKGRRGEPLHGYGHKFRVANIRASDGKSTWKSDETRSVGGHYAITFVRDGKAFVACERYLGYDLQSGSLDVNVPQRTYVNACAETRATPNYILYGMSFADRDGNLSPRAIVRSTCDTGVFPANGLIYCSPPLCACLDVVAGYSATAMEPTPQVIPAEKRTIRGNATVTFKGNANTWPNAKDWPMFMANPQRGSRTVANVSIESKIIWQEQVGVWPKGIIASDWQDAELASGPITAVTADGDRVFVAIPHENRLEARVAATGKLIWSFTTGGRIDSPPTLYRGLCLLGCRDGWVYALRAADGRLIWKFFAAVNQKRILDNSRLESPWPVFGSVMIHQEYVYCMAGRHSAADGGIQLYKLDPLSGKMLWNARISNGALGPTSRKEIPVYSIHGKIGKYYPRAAHLLVSDGKLLHHFIETLKDDYPPGTNVDVLASNGRWGRIDPKQMTWLRSNMMGFLSSRHESIGRFDHDGVRYSDLMATKIVLAGESLFCANGRRSGKKISLGELARVSLDHKGMVSDRPLWTTQVRHKEGKHKRGNFQVQSMLLAGDKLFLAGHLRDKSVSGIHAYSAYDGGKLAQWPLPSRPLKNGLATARGRIFVSLQNGTLICIGD